MSRNRVAGLRNLSIAVDAPVSFVAAAAMVEEVQSGGESSSSTLRVQDLKMNLEQNN
jgi:hypothetical protein